MVASGMLTFWYYNAKVLCVDFDNDMVTDFGYRGYSRGTDQNIDGWVQELRDMRFIGMECLRGLMMSLIGHIRWFDWTACATNNPKSPVASGRLRTHRDRIYARFCEGVPWRVMRDGFPWFHGPSYDDTVVENARRVMQEIFDDNVSWHWFTANWVNGLWTKQFISPAAEARWRARQEATS